jgi:hypothetical protein
MPAKERKPMTFSMNPTPAAAPPPVSIAKAEGVERQQVGARVTKSTYRQLKARAALAGASVQDLVEQAINEFLAKGTN